MYTCSAGSGLKKTALNACMSCKVVRMSVRERSWNLAASLNSPSQQDHVEPAKLSPKSLCKIVSWTLVEIFQGCGIKAFCGRALGSQFEPNQCRLSTRNCEA